MTIELHEMHPAKNWPKGRRPEWYDERCRLYYGIVFNNGGHQYRELLAHFDGEKTTLYLTDCGFNVAETGPIAYELPGTRAAYRKAVRELFKSKGHDVRIEV